MKRLWHKTGNLAFWLSYPLLKVYLRLGWRTRVLIIVDNHVLLVKGWLGNDSWQLPGGGAHRGESHEIAACREVREETGITLKSEQLRLLYQDRYQYRGISFRYKCFWLELPKKPVVKKQALEIIDYAWVPLLEVAQLNTSIDTQRAVQTWLQR